MYFNGRCILKLVGFEGPVCEFHGLVGLRDYEGPVDLLTHDAGGLSDALRRSPEKAAAKQPFPGESRSSAERRGNASTPGFQKTIASGKKATLSKDISGPI